jgi:Tfp pilus assembly protein PilF
MAKISRKKFQEALRALKSACKNDRLPFTLRIRAAELICAIYQIPLPQSAVRVKRAVKELVQEGSLDRQIREQVNERVRQDAEAEARRFLESVQHTKPQGEK